MKSKNICGFIIALFAILLYAQSVTFGFTVDDSNHISRNRITKEGIKSIPAIITHYYWYGSDDSIPRPEYRPASLIMFTTEWQAYKDNPHYYHAVNILLYAIICLLIFLLLCKLFDNRYIFFPFVCALLYASHPIHTEVVDNIKSGDELLCFLFGLLSLYFLLISIEKKSNAWTKGTIKEGGITETRGAKGRDGYIGMLILAIVCYFICIFSKETGIAYVLIVPLILYIFTKQGLKNILIFTSIYIIVAVIFLLIRYKVLEGITFDGIYDPANNSLLAAPDISSQKATAFYVLLRYLLLLIYPHPLVYDYSLATIPIFKLGDNKVFISISVYLLLGIYALINLMKIRNKKKPEVIRNADYGALFPNTLQAAIIAFSISFYLFMLFPVSNLLLIIGSPMAERFLFMPSLGFTILLALILFKITGMEKSDERHKRAVREKQDPVLRIPIQYVSRNSKYLFAVLFFIVGLYSYKTIARSRNWKNNYTLYKNDVKLSPQSARAHFNYGNVLLNDLYSTEKNKVLKQQYLDTSINEFKIAMRYSPDYSNIYLNLGRAYMNNNDNPDATKCFETYRILSSEQNYYVLSKLSILYINSGRYDKAISILDTAIKRFPGLKEFYNNKAYIYLRENRNLEAIQSGKNAIKLAPEFADAYINVGCAYCSLNEYDTALEYLKKAVSLDSLSQKQSISLDMHINTKES